MPRLFRILTLIFPIVAYQPGTAVAQTAVDLELILMADASGSVDFEEFQLQRRGYAQALRDPRIMSAVRFGRRGRIALSYVEWSGPELHEVIVPWTLVAQESDLEAIAKQLEQSERRLFGGGTAIGNALIYGAKSLLGNAFQGERLVIDISGDDVERGGLPAALGRNFAVERNIVVNGLAIHEYWPELAEFFREHVIGGVGAFVVEAKGFGDFTRAVRRKLVLEIAGAPPSTVPLAASVMGPETAAPAARRVMPLAR